MSEHSPEPWSYGWRRGPGERVSYIRDANGLAVLDTETDQNWFPSDDILRRIVACVNALQGVPTEVLESGVVKELFDEIFSGKFRVTSDARPDLAVNLEAWINSEESPLKDRE